ncbi:hypothetical protein [Achromobacter phage SE2]|nr:hypothetical protein [Achromobacter phage SE2]
MERLRVQKSVTRPYELYAPAIITQVVLKAHEEIVTRCY